MEKRALGKTGLAVSEVSLGTWQVGGRWGSAFDDALAENILEAAIERGVNFIDTADVYSDRASEAAVGRVVRRHRSRGGAPVYVATKCGRFLSPHVPEAYTPAALRAFVERSLENTGLDRLDLIQLHCPPSAVYERPEIFEVFDRMKDEGKIGALGVSVEKIGEALRAVEYDNVATVQIIFNLFRFRPADEFFAKAREKNVGIIARVPLASGLLSGRYSTSTTFGPDDHRSFNRDGAAFDKGETFSGVPYEVGLAAAEELGLKLESGVPLAHHALRFVLSFPEVSTVIPGASNLGQLEENLRAAGLAAFSATEMASARDIYDRLIRKHVHHLW